MNSIIWPALLIIAGIAAALVTYRNIRRGGARFYTLERETVLRRALLSLGASVLFFLAAIGLLFYQRQQLVEALAPPTEEVIDAGDGTPAPVGTPFIEQFPPTATATSTTPQPTETATPTLCRGVIDGTGGNGLTLRDAPQGAEIIVLPDGTLLTVLDDPPVESGGLVWRKVRAVGGDEGWVAQDFLTIRAPCGEE
jgi:hypothetical protein